MHVPAARHPGVWIVEHVWREACGWSMLSAPLSGKQFSLRAAGGSGRCYSALRPAFRQIAESRLRCCATHSRVPNCQMPQDGPELDAELDRLMEMASRCAALLCPLLTVCRAHY